MDALDRLCSLRDRPERLALGLMSGMSHDGLDLALVRLRDRERGGLDVELRAHATVPYAPELRARIRAAVHGTTRDVCTLDFELAELWARDVLAFLSAEGVAPSDVSVLGSHGQTIDHVPRVAGGTAATLQVGDGDVLAERTGLLTVSDFRSRDVAAGGEGAPLVPFAEWLLHAAPGEVTACQNLGSIGNVTVVTERPEDVLAFDTGPANALIDAFARKAEGRADAIDRDGRLSAAGRVDDRVLATLHELSRGFLERPPPKSAGYDDFGPALGDRVADLHADARPEDLVRTAAVFTAVTVADAYERWVRPACPALTTVRLTGGGALNPTVTAELRTRLAALGLELDVPEDAWIEAKEAVAFALLADATVRGRPGNLPSATGAREAVVLGKISL